MFAADASTQRNRAADRNPASAGQGRQPNLTLFIPYDPDKEKPLQKHAGLLAARRVPAFVETGPSRQAKSRTPNVRAIVSHAEYSGRLENDVARFDGRLVIHHFVDGWTRVVLPLGKVALEKIEINGRPATLADDGRDQPAIYLDKPGPHVVDVRFSVPVSRLGRPAR